MRKTKKLKNKPFVISALKKFQWGTLIFAKSVVAKNSLYVISKSFNKKPKENDFITTKPKNSIKDISFEKNGQMHVTVDVTLADLKKFIKKAEKDISSLKKTNAKRKKEKLPVFNLCFRHVSPDVSFLVRF